MEILGTIVIGGLAGWLGSKIYSGSGLGIIGNILIGIAGSFVGYWLLGLIGVNFGTGWLGAIITGALGAIIILFLINSIVGKK